MPGPFLDQFPVPPGFFLPNTSDPLFFRRGHPIAHHICSNTAFLPIRTRSLQLLAAACARPCAAPPIFSFRPFFPTPQVDAFFFFLSILIAHFFPKARFLPAFCSPWIQLRLLNAVFPFCCRCHSCAPQSFPCGSPVCLAPPPVLSLTPRTLPDSFLLLCLSPPAKG